MQRPPGRASPPDPDNTPEEATGRPPGSTGSWPSAGLLGSSLHLPWSSRDPRTSSVQSLAPSTGDDGDQKRKLLVIYIHGYKGSTTSFRSFPAHVHNLLKTLLAETHVVHTKIYPRYKTYKSIEVATENFSQWLAPHESPSTDVVLVGHSMGGLLAAEVALLPNQEPYSSSWPFRHRILGTISLDAPLLGLHPGVVLSGISSLFRASPKPPAIGGDTAADQPNPRAPGNLSPSLPASPPSGASSPSLRRWSSSSTVSSWAIDDETQRDPCFNPAFPNDVSYVDRGWFKNMVHFVTKYKDENLFRAAVNHIMAHAEYGACLTDLAGLRSRYNRLRELEDGLAWDGRPGAVRVRFVQYYTVSTGIEKKKSRSPSPAGPWRQRHHDDPYSPSARSSFDSGELGLTPRMSRESGASTPRISIGDYTENPKLRRDFASLESVLENCPPERPLSASETEREPEQKPDPGPVEPVSPRQTPPIPRPPPPQEEGQGRNVPSIPDLPSFPPPPDPAAYPDKESRKRAEAAFKLASKAYARAVKARDKAIRAFEKDQRKAAKASRKREKQQKAPPPQPPRPVSAPVVQFHESTPLASHENAPPPPPPPPPPPLPSSSSSSPSSPTSQKPRRRRKFCNLPKPSSSSGTADGQDPTWIEVFMEGVDEVGAHTGLFISGAAHYKRLVDDVGERIAGWVWEDAARRFLEREEREQRERGENGDEKKRDADNGSERC
ncbi:hypothetical protein VTJ83DRAFT_5850 [Remersonia thermophila]|uniref:DUF676 domain-containing protein n=1 Tax=Remersonia thermophila TaxID=72144 RepID=A0ABR4D807_9PEZI